MEFSLDVKPHLTKVSYVFFQVNLRFAMEQSREEIGSDFVEVSRDLKKYVIGRGGCVIEEIRRTSGARVNTRSMEEEGFTVNGNEKQRACAKRLILQKVVSW